MRRLAAVGPELSDEDLLALRRAPSPQDAPGPWVRAVFVSSLDGATALDGRSGTLGSPADRRQFALARTDADVILVGAGTVRAEGYAGPLVDAAARARRAARGLPEHPAVAVVTGSLDLDPDGEFFRAAPVRPWVIASERAVADRPERAAALAELADVLTAGVRDVEPRELLALLAGRGVRVVHCEGGPTLFGALAAAGAVDELLLTLSSLLAGGAGPRLLPAVEGIGLPARMLPHHVLTQDGDLYLRLLHERHAALLADAPGLDGRAGTGR